MLLLLCVTEVINYSLLLRIDITGAQAVSLVAAIGHRNVLLSPKMCARENGGRRAAVFESSNKIAVYFSLLCNVRRARQAGRQVVNLSASYRRWKKNIRNQVNKGISSSSSSSS